MQKTVAVKKRGRFWLYVICSPGLKCDDVNTITYHTAVNT